MCGIFGYIQTSPSRKSDFSKVKYAVLGSINDKRGGDSAGAFIDGNYEYGIGATKLFADFVTTETSSFVRNINDSTVQVALGHCRKASVGKLTVDQAQPVVITNAEGKVEFVMIHNGTLVNYTELSEKYLRNVPADFTDSQIFAHVVYYQGFDVLTEYQGAGAFVFVDYRQVSPIISIFKGKSKSYQSSTVTTEERPLYMVNTPNGFWFSSIKESLGLIQLSSKDLIDIEHNTLFSYCKTWENPKTVVYDRSENHQHKSAAVTPYRSNYGGNYGYSDYDDYPTSNYSKQSSYKSTVTYGAITVLTPLSDQSHGATSRKVVMEGGKYKMMGEWLSGRHFITPYGYSPQTKTSEAKPFFFFKGHRLTDEYSYNLLCAIEQVIESSYPTFPLWKAIRCLSEDLYYNELTKLWENGEGEPGSGVLHVYFYTKNRYYKIRDGKPTTYTEDSVCSRCEKTQQAVASESVAVTKEELELTAKGIIEWLISNESEHDAKN